MDPRYVDIIRWTNNAGEFVLLRAEEVARLWGLRKDNNHRMNYDKLSRALRYYYQKNIIRKVQGHKFVYQFIGLQRFNLSNRPQGMEKAIIDSSPPPPPAEQAKHQRRQSAPNKPSFNVSSDSALIGYSPFQKHANPFAESLLALKQQQQQHQQITIPQTLSTTTQDASKLNQSIFEQVFPANLSQSLDYGVSSTSTPTSSTSQSTNNSSSSSSSFHPVYSNSACDLSKLYANLPKNNEPLHLSHRVDENMSGAMDLHTCKEMMAHAFLPHDRPAAKRSCSPNCHCSCHDSLTSHKSCENRPMHYNQPANLTQSHSGTAVNPVGGFRKPRPIDCWTPLRGGNQLGDHLVMQSAALDQRSVLHWQRHMINMNRFKEQIERFSVWTGGEERKVLPLQSHSISQSQPRQTQAETIIRPCDVLRVGSEAMDTEPACLRESSQCSSNSENQSSSSSCGSSGSGNYIWMPIQVDLVEHFMSMISQTIQDNKSMEPPAAHSSSNPWRRSQTNCFIE